MRIFTVISVLILLVLSAACTTSGDGVTSPVLPESLQSNGTVDDYISECRANMRTIASQAVIFFANNEYYPSSLDEIGMAGVVCEECQLPYTLIGDTKIFYVGCPMPTDPNHGNIDNGVASWFAEPPDPSQWENVCRANMRTIASQAVIYFAGHDCYPNNQREIEMAGVVCPGCGDEYQLVGTETEFYVGCPMPTDPNHGNIDDGVASWHQGE